MISFALLSNDRLLVVEFAEIELLVFELLWKNHYGATDGSQPAAEENGNAKRGLFAGEMAETSDDLGNVIMDCKKRGTLLRQASEKALQTCSLWTRSSSAASEAKPSTSSGSTPKRKAPCAWSPGGRD